MSARQFDIHYPKNYSYKTAVKKLLEMTEGNEKKPDVATLQSTSLPSTFNPQEGDRRKKYLLKDGGRLTIIHRGKEIYYHLKLKDGRQVILERMETSMMLILTDSNGRHVKNLTCELKK